MKYAFAAVALAAVARAQTLADIPECALPALQAAVESQSDCSLEDLACVCGSFNDIRTAAAPQILEDCGSDVAFNEVLPAASALCANPPPAAESSAPASSSAAASTSVAVSTSVEVIETTTAVELPSPTPEPSTTVVVPPVGGNSTIAPPHSTPGIPAPPPTEAPPSGAAAIGSVGALAMLVLGALAL